MANIEARGLVSKGLRLDDYEDADGQRILRGLFDEMFEHVLKGRIHMACEVTAGVWRRAWYCDIPGLGIVNFIWKEDSSYGRTWLKEKDKKFARVLKEMDYISKENIEVDGDIVSESSDGSYVM
jgi:hypothetical protein